MYVVKFFFMVCICGLPLLAGEADEWVKRLGAAEYADREAAQRALWEMGAPALPAVREASRSSDPEIRRRAGEILPYIALGVRPDWPEQLQQGALRFSSFSDAGREEFLSDLARELGKDAIPFLVSEVGGTASGRAIKLLEARFEDPDAVEQVISLLSPQPDNGDAAILLAKALKKAERKDADLIALGLKALPERERKRLLNEGLDEMLRLHDEKAYPELLALARQYRAFVEDDIRLMYMEGLGAFHIKDLHLAESLFGQAKALHPGDEAAHYLAAVMLEKTGHDNLTAGEWERVLEIPPEGGVYDMNAYLQLGSLNRKKKDYERAANAYENALLLYRKAKESGKGMGLVGASEEELSALIETLRGEKKVIHLGENPLRPSMEVMLKKEQAEDQKALLKTLTGELSFTVQPYGFRLLEKAPSTVIFDRETSQLRLTLNGKAFGEASEYKWREGVNRILLRTLDMRYIVELDPESGEGEIIHRFELDYLFKILPNDIVRGLREPKLILNDESYSWEEMEEGIPMDFLPEKIEFIFRGKNEEGIAVKAEINFDPRKEAPDIP